jgi:GT2 family glycosyltransferase
MAQGDFVAFLTQDACPADEFWLYNLVATLEHFPDGAGVFGRHIAWPHASPFSKRDIASFFDSFAQHPIAVSRKTDAVRWANGDRRWRQMLHFFSNNNSCLRRSTWERYPFPEVDYGEDQTWADMVISAGFERVYAPGAVVYHSHDYSPTELEKRMTTEAHFFKQHFGYEMLGSGRSFDAELQARNAEDELWAAANNIGANALNRRLRENKAWLRGLLKGAAL